MRPQWHVAWRGESEVDVDNIGCERPSWGFVVVCVCVCF